MNHVLELMKLSSQIEKEYGIKAFIDSITEILCDILGEEFYVEDTEEMMSIFFNLTFSRNINVNDDCQTLLANTASKHGIHLYEQILIDEFLKLSAVDKIVEKDDTSFFLLLDQLFNYIALAMDYLSKWEVLSKVDDTIIRGVALSKSKTPKKILQSHINYIDKALLLTPTNKSLLFLKEVVERFLNSPDEINSVLFGTYLLDFNKYEDLDQDKLSTLDGLHQLLNSSSPVEISHIHDSVKCFIQMLFFKDGYWQKILKIENPISNESLANIIDIIMQYGFNIDSKTSPEAIKRIVQRRTFFFDFPIFEFQTIRNTKSDPLLEDEEAFQMILEKLRGKFPLRSSVPNLPEQI